MELSLLSASAKKPLQQQSFMTLVECSTNWKKSYNLPSAKKLYWLLRQENSCNPFSFMCLSCRQQLILIYYSGSGAKT